MKRDELRQILIDGTIHVIAVDGFDKATTKQVCSKIGVNEAYIYRCFQGKEDMFAQTFDSLDKELFDVIMGCLDVMHMTGLAFDVRCKVFFFKLWEFLLGNKEKCVAYIRYYYSPYFMKNSATVHKQRFWPIVEAFQDSFLEEADVWMILNHILNVMMDFAIKVHNGQMEKSNNYAEHVFRVVYTSTEQYFKK